MKKQMDKETLSRAPVEHPVIHCTIARKQKNAILKFCYFIGKNLSFITRLLKKKIGTKFEKKTNLFLIFENGSQILIFFENGYNQLKDHEKN